MSSYIHQAGIVDTADVFVRGKRVAPGIHRPEMEGRTIAIAVVGSMGCERRNDQQQSQVGADQNFCENSE